MGFYPNTDVLCVVMTDLFTRTLATPAADRVRRHSRTRYDGCVNRYRPGTSPARSTFRW